MTNPRGTLGFADLLEVLGHDDHVALCTQTPGGAFTSTVVAAADAATWHVPADRNAWFSVNPLAGPARTQAGRGTVKDVVRLSALYADLDVKTGGLDTFDTAHDVVSVLAEVLGSRPTAITLSGNGLQPYWPLEETVTGPDAMALLRRFGRLVRHIASLHGGKVDSVYDLARVLRVPGSVNLKDPTQPKPVLTLDDTGHPLTAVDIDEALNAYGAVEQPEDREELGAVVAAPAGWAWAERTCHYAKSMVASWASESPTARHPWLLAQATRIAASHRYGCFTAGDHDDAVAALAHRFRSLLAGGEVRAEQPGEIADAVAWGRETVATKTGTALAAEIGEHTHGDAVLQLLPNPSPASAAAWTPTVIQGGAGAPDTTPAAPTRGATALAPQPGNQTLERSEDGHAHHLIASYGDLIRYCPERGLWLAWNGSRWAWQPKSGGVVREYAKNVARAFPQGDQAALVHKRRCLSSQGISGCLKQAETDPRINVAMGELDADPWTLNTPAGAVDLRTGRLSDPDPKTLCTKTTTVAPAITPDPLWEKFLDDTFADDRETREYVQRLVGLTLVGQVREQLLAFLHGQGANGKSTLTKVLMRVLGTGEAGYAVAAAAEMLMIRKHAEHPAEIAKLAGARMVVCSELDDSQRFNEARIKDLTGGDMMDARFLYGQPFTFNPTHTMWLYGNKRPQAHSGGMAFWRRVKLIELKHVVPVHLRDTALDDKLYAAGGTVLAWAIAGAVDYLAHGIQEPAGVSEATAAYAADQDTVGRFVADSCHRADAEMVRVPTAQLRTAYEAWCREVGEQPASPKRLTQELRDRFGVGEHRSNGRRFYTRICLLDTSEEAESSSATSGSEEPEEWWQR